MTVAGLLAELQATFPAGHTSGTFAAPAVQGGAYVPLLTRLGIPTTLALTSQDGWVEQDGGVGLKGTLETRALGVDDAPVQFAFTPSGTAFDLALTLTLPEGWRFPQSFASLRGGVFDELGLAPDRPAALTVASAAPAPGLSFSGTLASDSAVIATLAWLIEQGAPLAVSGPVGYDAQRGTVDMTLALAAGSIRDLFGASGPELGFQLALWSGLDAAIGQYRAGIRFETSLDFGETIDLAALLEGTDQGVLDITLSGSALAFPEPATLERYFGAGNGIAAALPDKFHGGNLVQVDELTFGIGLTTRSLEYAFLTAGALEGQSWPLWPGVIELGDLQFRFQVYRPLEPDAVVYAFTFNATLTFGDTVPLLVTAELPGEVISAGLDRTRPPVKLTPYVREVFGDTFGLPEELLIADLDLIADVKQSVYGGRVEIEGEWEFDFGTENTVTFEDLRIELDYTPADSASGAVAARFAVGRNDFAVAFELTKGNTRITGEWHAKREPLTYQDIAIALGMYGLPNLPPALDLELTEAKFEFDSAGPSFSFDIETRSGGAAALIAGKDKQGDWGFVYGMILSLDVSVDLTDIAVIGKLVPAGYDTFSLSDLRVVGATTALPVYQSTPDLKRIIGPTVDSGLVLSTQVEVGSAVDLPLSVRFGGADDGTAVDTPPSGALAVWAPGGATPGPQATWVDVQRAFGPVQFERVGFAITTDDEVALLVDASVSLAGLTLGLVGLEAAMPLKAPYLPVFDLAGLQVGFNGGAVQISGGLDKVPDAPAAEYTGELVVEVASFGLTVLGSYTTVDDHPSLFVFLFLAAPLGGPPFFFVTGLAGGFGYNRSLRLPTIDEVATYPLVAGATGKLDAATTESELDQLIEPQLGEDWLAAGVSFTSFETLKSFALLTVAFGNQVEVALMGESTISVPPAAEGETPAPTAQAQMVILVDYAPAQGQLAVCAQLTPESYVLAQAARLTGGFAFYVWFAPSPHAGDFVVTLGGYNPYFTPPSHYPTVPRLGLNWKISDELTIAGGLYFALTPSVLMAGGELAATWQSGALSASFVARADFLIRFKPFQYLIDVDVSISVSLTLDLLVTTTTITIHVSVALDLWGPPFGGVARVDLWIVSFSIPFGADRPGTLPDLKWPQFRSSFLPAAGGVTLTAAAGLGSAAQPVWLVDPTKLRLSVATQVPSSDATVVTATTSKPQGGWNTQLGIGPMGVAPGDLSAVLTIAIERDGEGDRHVWNAAATTGGVPAGLWKQADNQMRTDGLVDHAMTGVTLAPAPPAADQTLPVPLTALADAEPAVRTFAWSPATVPDSDPFDQEKALATLQSSLVDAGAKRTALLESLKAEGLRITTTVDVAGFAANAPDLLASPPLLRVLGEERAA